MAFKNANLARLVKFNSATSSDFIDRYEKFVDSKIAAKNAEPKHKTFAPSSFRCPRVSWFRLRGVQPDTIAKPDRTLAFTAELGTACHSVIQRNLIEMLGADWIDVEDYLKSIDFPYNYTITKNGYEVQIELDSPPVRFACDGIIRLNGKYYLLEIKTSEYSSFDDLMDVKSEHEDQYKFYGTILQLDDILVLYQDRQYGGLKCYEKHITEADKSFIWDRIHHVLEMVAANIAPERLPNGDHWCSANMCPYHKVCKQWG